MITVSAPHPAQAAHHRQGPGAAAAGGSGQDMAAAAHHPAAEPAVTSRPEAPTGALKPDEPEGGPGPSPAAKQVRMRVPLLASILDP
jgi:hypothetical protein